MSEPQKSQKEEQSQKENPIERVFLANDLLPNASDAFLAQVDPIKDVIDVADIVLDTNVLLLPYGAGASGLGEVIAIFKKLKGEGRIFIPAQAAREFVKNRPNKLSELQQGLSAKISRYIEIEKLSFPMLEDVDEYKQLNDALEKTAKLKAELGRINSALLKKIRSWEWNDPVNTAYREVFTADRIVEPTFKRDDTLAELLKRQSLLIPPGYKDSAKDDLGIGDFLIWKTIVEIGAKNKKHVIFVSGDEKADWMHRSNKEGILPRYELIDEFRRASSGKSFYILQLSNLLELLNVKKDSIAAIKKEEERIQDATNVVVDCPYCEAKVQCYLALYPKSSASPTCPTCLHGFHVHRTTYGIITRRSNLPTKSEIESDTPASVKISCPNCDAEIEALLGTYRGATKVCRCHRCEARINIHRGSEGNVVTGVFR